MLAGMVATSSSATDPVLVARGVRRVFRSGSGDVVALSDVDLSLPRGGFVAVTGPSGSGKTTLLQCLSGLDDIDGGSVVLDGEDVHAGRDARRAARRAQRNGFVFQSGNLVDVFSAVENVELPLIAAGVGAVEARRRAEEALRRVGLGARLGHRPGELSGGEQQRVAVARAVVGDPLVVWADEPTGSLDSTAGARVLDLLAEVNAAGVTVVVVTHDPAVAERAEQRIVLRDGRIVEGGTSPGRRQRRRPPAA